MNKSIWKFILAEQDEQFIILPKGAKPLTVQVQNESLCLWALVDVAQSQTTTRRVVIHGTGHPADDVGGMKYVGTVQMYGGSLVLHCFISEET